MRRLAILLLFAALVVTGYLTGLFDQLSLEQLGGNRDRLIRLKAEEPLLVMAIFWLVYAAAIALSIPGAVLSLSLAAGAMFGLLAGTLIVTSAKTIGSCIAFILARFLGRDWVRSRFERQLRTIDKGVRRDGALYLLILRFSAVVPYFVINLGMALTSMRLSTFALVTLLGTVPLTMIYVNAGTRLAQIREVSDIVSVEVLGSLFLLAVFPLFAKWGIAWLRGRRTVQRQD